jgi:hypothetical protein
MTDFTTLHRPRERTAIAPDGSDVRVLLGVAAGAMAEFELAAGAVSRAATHRTVEEIWYVLRGRGEMWRRQGAREDVARLAARRAGGHDAPVAWRRRGEDRHGALAADRRNAPRWHVIGLERARVRDSIDPMTEEEP